MTDTPQEPPDETGSPSADERDEDDRDPDDRTADPDLGPQDAGEIFTQPQSPVEPDDPDVAT